MTKRNCCQELIAPRRWVLARLLKRIEKRRSDADEKDKVVLDALHTRCLAMCKVANGCSHATVEEKLHEEGKRVTRAVLKAWTRSLARRLSEWKEGAGEFGQGMRRKNRRLPASVLESFLLDNRLRAHRERKRTDKKLVALEILNEHAVNLPCGITSWRGWRERDLIFVLWTGCVPPRVMAQARLISPQPNVETKLNKALWWRQYQDWLDAYPKGALWRDLTEEIAAVKRREKEKMRGFRFRVIPPEKQLSISLRTAWTLLHPDSTKKG